MADYIKREDVLKKLADKKNILKLLTSEDSHLHGATYIRGYRAATQIVSEMPIIKVTEEDEEEE